MKPCRTKWQKKWLALDVVRPSIQNLADIAEAFCGRWMQNNTHQSMLVIVGKFGSGKTHTAKAILRFCIAACMKAFETEKWGKHKLPNAVFVSWPEAASAFAEKRFGLMEDTFEHDLVIIDDIGAENDPWQICADKLCQILSRRENKFTVITTNVAPENWISRFDGRINDRLLRNSIVINIGDVESYAMKE